MAPTGLLTPRNDRKGFQRLWIDCTGLLFRNLVWLATLPRNLKPFPRRSSRTIDTGRTGKCRVCIFLPSVPPSSARGVIVHSHGGGWTIGQPEYESAICGYLAEKLQTIVVAPDYWKAPQYPYPFALEQMHNLLSWIASGGLGLLLNIPYDSALIDPSRICLTGGSAGANIAAALCAMTVDRPLPSDSKIVAQGLLYPVLELSKPRDEKEAEMPIKRKDRHMPPWMGRLFYRAYLPPPASARDPLVSPVFISEDVAKKQPTTVVIPAELDFLLQDGEKYAKKLQDAGVPVVYHIMKGAVHGFDVVPTYTEEQRVQSEKAKEEAYQVIADAFAPLIS